MQSDLQKDPGGSADCNKAVCVSSKPAHGTLEKVSTNKKAPVIEVIEGGANHGSSNTHETKGNEVSKDNGSGSVDISSIVEFPKGDGKSKSFSDVSALKVYFHNALVISIYLQLFFFLNILVAFV